MKQDDKVQNLVDKIAQQDIIIKNLNDMYNTLLENDRLKTEFFSNISHELRTHISIVAGSVQLLEQRGICAAKDNGIDNSKCSKHFNVIKRNTKLLMQFVNNLLDMAQIDSGFMNLNPSVFNVIELTKEIISSVNPLAEQNYVKLILNSKQVRNPELNIDKEKYERILINLLSNAIKFSNAGGTVTITLIKNRDTFSLSVRDEGSGIPQQMQKEIFKRFKQSGSTCKDSKGTGIGLSLVKHFTEMHDGKIHVKSELGNGSEFIVEIPSQFQQNNVAISEIQISSNSAV